MTAGGTIRAPRPQGAAVHDRGLVRPLRSPARSDPAASLPITLTPINTNPVKENQQ